MDFNPEAVDAAAEEALDDFASAFTGREINRFVAWWSRWYMKAGHKRLGRHLVAIHKAGGMQSTPSFVDGKEVE